MGTQRMMVIDTATDDRDQDVPKILCIDDDPGITKSLELRLNVFDVTIRTATSGMQGYTIATEERPDVIITDLRMPYGDGETLVQFLKRTDETCLIPIIVLTGLRIDDIPVPLLHMNEVKFFRKPVRFELLLDELRQHISLKSKSQEELGYQYEGDRNKT